MQLPGCDSLATCCNFAHDLWGIRPEMYQGFTQQWFSTDIHCARVSAKRIPILHACFPLDNCHLTSQVPSTPTPFLGSMQLRSMSVSLFFILIAFHKTQDPNWFSPSPTIYRTPGFDTAHPSSHLSSWHPLSQCLSPQCQTSYGPFWGCTHPSPSRTGGSSFTRPS
jgi:hypothetical protein